jgi:hypothetical protein
MEVIATLSAWLAGPDQAPLGRSIASWIKRLQERELPRLELPDVLSLLEDETMGERFQRKYATWEDAIEDRGRLKGREEGMRSVLKQLLTKRFGELSPAAAARVDQADEAEAARWIDRVLVADSIEAVLS